MNAAAQHVEARAFRRGVDHRLCDCGDCGLGFGVTKEDEKIEQVYECDTCGRTVPWCFGAHDEMPGSCDACWAEAQDPGVCETCGGPADFDDADRVQCDCGTTVCSDCCVAYNGESYCSIECGKDMEAAARKENDDE